MVRALLLGLFVATSSLSAQAETLHLTIGTHVRRELSRDLGTADTVGTIAIANPDILRVDPVTPRDVLIQGIAIGVTTVTIRFADGSWESLDVEVEPDISLLVDALEELDPQIKVRIAHDRDAVVLAGSVAGPSERLAALGMAQQFLDARRTDEIPLVRPDGAVAVDSSLDERRARGRSRGRVLDLLRVRELPVSIEDRIRDAILPLGGESVRVRRVLAGALPDDERDVLVLEGTVRDQIALSRILHLTSRLYGGEESSTDQDDLRVLGIEGGGLQRGGGGLGGGGQGGGLGGGGGVLGGGPGGGGQGGGFAGGGGGLGGGGGGGRGGRGNQIQQNIARATTVEAAGGRVLSFIEVDELPLVRVLVRIYEVDRNALFDWSPAQGAQIGNVDQAPLLPTGTGSRIQGVDATRVGGADGPELQNAVDFLTGSGLTNEFQIAGSRLALTSLFSLLAADGIAREVASPTLTVLSGEFANFQVGGQVPVPQAFTPAFGGATGGTGTFTSVVFQSFGILLGVRPQVGRAGRVTLDLQSLVSSPDTDLTSLLGGTGVSTLPTTAFATRSITSSSQLDDGQALLVGGLIQRSQSVEESKAPFFGDLPILGWLFRSRQTVDTDTELFVLVSPAVVREPIPDAELWEFPCIDDSLRALANGG